jgi:RNA recognition motif-containing protein
LSFSVDEEALKEAFSKMGKVRFTKILKNEDGTSKGRGFVNFFSVEDAKNAICESENIKIDGRYFLN